MSKITKVGEPVTVLAGGNYGRAYKHGATVEKIERGGLTITLAYTLDTNRTWSIIGREINPKVWTWRSKVNGYRPKGNKTSYYSLKIGEAVDWVEEGMF